MEFSLDLNTIWFVLIGVLMAGYAILDGFDLGIGALHLIAKTDDERRIMLNSIGPVWDGNEVWLVTGGGALFAAFPEVYATVFSGFYNAIILLLFMLIFRAVAIEFRSKKTMKWWRLTWDISFSIASILIAFILGIVLGNVITGIQLGPDKEYVGAFIELVNPYSILVGITTVALFMMHGSIYGVLKTEGELQNKLKGWVKNSIIFFVICYVSTTMVTLIYYPHMARHFVTFPPLFIIALLNMFAIANIPREINRGKDFLAFLSSSASIALLLILFAIGIFPNLVLSNPNPQYSLTIYNSASSETTLTIMLIIAGIGFPFVLAYTISIYWIFRGKVKLTNMSY